MEQQTPELPKLDIEGLRKKLDSANYMDEAIEMLARELSAELLDQSDGGNPRLIQ
jgi:hypothetical protein